MYPMAHIFHSKYVVLQTMKEFVPKERMRKREENVRGALKIFGLIENVKFVHERQFCCKH